MVILFPYMTHLRYALLHLHEKNYFYYKINPGRQSYLSSRPIYSVRFLQFLCKSPTAPVLPPLEILPLLLYVSVSFQLHVALGEFIAVGNISRNQFRKDQRIDAFALILRLDRYKQQVDNIGIATDSLKQRPPAEREKASAALSQRLR